MSSSNIRMKGYMYKLPVKGYVKKWSKRWFVFYATSHEGVIRLEYFDNEACERSGLGKRTIPLRDCSGVNQTVGDKAHPYVFELQSQIGHHIFGCDSSTDLEEWVEGIKEALREDKMKRRQKKTQSLVFNRQEATDYSELPTRKVCGTSYTSEIEEGVYRVTIEENETAIKMALHGEYNLEISPRTISLVASNTTATIAVWNYKHLKNYGKQHGRFHFETGKSAPTGAGNFVCVTTCSKEIFGVVHRNIKKMRITRDQAQKEPVTKQVQEATASLRKQQVSQVKGKHNLPPVKQRAHDTSYNSQQASRQASVEIAGESTTGKFRSSRDFDMEQKKLLEEADVENHYSLASDSDQFDPSHIYTPVKKNTGPRSKLQLDNKEAADTREATNGEQQSMPVDGAPLTPFDKTSTPTLTADANRFSYGSARDSRDSALINLHGNFFGSLEEEDTLLPLMTGVKNPMDNESFVAPDGADDLINFDMDKLNDDFFDKLDQMRGNDLQSSTTGAQMSAGVVGTGQSSSHKAKERPKPPEKRLSQQQFDQIWDNIYSTMPALGSERNV